MLQAVLSRAGQFSLRPMLVPQPAAGEALVRVHRVGIAESDMQAFHGTAHAFSYPRVPGRELGVEVLALGEGAEHVRIGDRCAVEPYLSCGECAACRRGKPQCCAALRVIGVEVDGGMGTFLTLPACNLHPSSKLDYEQLAVIDRLAQGAHAMERANVQPDDTVLIRGTTATALATAQLVGVTRARVALLGSDETRLAFCREALGVAAVFQEGPDAAAQLDVFFGGEAPSVIIDAVGDEKEAASSSRSVIDLIADGGRLVFTGALPSLERVDDRRFHERELSLLATRHALPSTFRAVIRLVENGLIDTRPWLAHRFKLTEIQNVFDRDLFRDAAVLKALLLVE